MTFEVRYIQSYDSWAVCWRKAGVHTWAPNKIEADKICARLNAQELVAAQ